MKGKAIYTKTNSFLRILIVAILGCAILSAIITMVKYNATYPAEFNFSESPYILLGLTFILAGVGLFAAIRPQKRTSLILPISFLVANAMAICLILLTDTKPVSDYEDIWNTAVLMANSDFNVSDLHYYDYMYVYNWQLGISFIESLFIRMFGPDIISLQIFNVILLNITLLLTYLLGKRFVGKSGAAYCVFGLATFFPVIITMPQFSNQHLACVFILAVLLLLKSKKIWKWLLAGVLIAVLNMIRPMGIILIIAILCYCAVLLIKSENRKKALTVLVCVLVSFIGCSAAINAAFIKAGYADSAITSAKVPYFKFDKGLTGYDMPEVCKFNSIEEYNEWEKQKLADNIKHNTVQVGTFVITKMIRYLGCFDYKVEMTYNHDRKIWNVAPVKNWVMFGWGQYIGLVILAFIGCWKNKKFDYCQPAFIFYVGITLVYFFIEAFTSYRYESYPLLLMLTAMSLPYIPKNLSFRTPKLCR